MFSAVYRFNYRSKELEWLDSPALSSALSDQSSSDDTNTPCTIQPSVPFDALLPMDPASFSEYDDFDTYFDFNGMDVKPSWEFRSSSEYSSDSMSSGYEPFQSCGGDQRHVFDRASMSPAEVCFPTDLYNYASCFDMLNDVFC